jgi:hypothetical protein
MLEERAHSRELEGTSSVGEALTLRRDSFTLERCTLELRGRKGEGGCYLWYFA